MNRELGKLHPAVNLILFIALIVLSSASLNPVLSPFALLAAVLTAAVTGKAARLLPALVMLLPMTAVILAVTVLFNGNGVTLLFTLFGKPVTLEAVVYGLLSGVAFAAVLLWACLLGEVLGADEIVYLFGGISPYPALLMSMVLGLIPTMLSRFEQIRDLRKSGTSAKKAVHTEMTALVFWSMEASLETAASMRSRGFGVCKVNRLYTYRFRTADAVVSAAAVLLLSTAVISKAAGYSYSVYPIFTLPEADLPTCFYSAAFCLIMLVPFAHEMWEKIKWRYLVPKA